MVLVVAVTGNIPTAAVLDVPRLPGEDVPDVLPLPVLVPASLNLVSSGGRPPHKVRRETVLQEGLLCIVGLHQTGEDRQQTDKDRDRDRERHPRLILTELRAQITEQLTSLIRFTFNILH